MQRNARSATADATVMLHIFQVTSSSAEKMKATKIIPWK